MTACVGMKVKNKCVFNLSSMPHYGGLRFLFAGGIHANVGLIVGFCTLEHSLRLILAFIVSFCGGTSIYIGTNKVIFSVLLLRINNIQ